jgi:hypothetical protein
MAVRVAPFVLLGIAGVAEAGDPPTVAVKDVAGAVAAAAKIDATAPRGVGQTIGTIDTATAADAKVVRDALVAKGFAIVDSFEADGTAVMTVDAKGVRATVSIGKDSGQIVVVANPSSVKPPGACVAVPNVKHPMRVISGAINQDGEYHDGETFWGFKTVRLADVDGDGILDAFVPIAKPYDCPEDVQWRVYAMRGSCGHDLGVVGKGAIQPTAMGPVAASGFRPIVVTSDRRAAASPDPEMAHTATTFTFSTKTGRYEQTDVKSSSGLCHHCARWHCTPGSPPQAVDVESVRRPAVAGSLSRRARCARPDGRPPVAAAKPGPIPKALIVPHAGYIYSGAIAASGFARIAGANLSRIVLVGPAHRVFVDGLAWPGTAQLRTPLGDVAVDLDAVRRIDATADAAAHAREHSLEVELPFLQRLAPAAKIVPLIGSRASAEESARSTRCGAARRR